MWMRSTHSVIHQLPSLWSSTVCSPEGPESRITESLIHMGMNIWGPAAASGNYCKKQHNKRRRRRMKRRWWCCSLLSISSTGSPAVSHRNTNKDALLTKKTGKHRTTLRSLVTVLTFSVFQSVSSSIHQPSVYAYLARVASLNEISSSPFSLCAITIPASVVGQLAPQRSLSDAFTKP